MEDADKNDPDSRLALVLIRSLRLWDQAELARAAHISPSQLSVYERGERPTPRNVLERAAEATGFPVYLIDSLLPALRSFRMATRGRFSPNRAFAARFAAEMMGLAQEAMDLILKPFELPAPEPEDVEELWAHLEASARSDRRMLVEELEEYQSADLCVRVSTESLRKAPDDPQEALELAELAVLIAERLPEEDAGSQRLQGYAWAHVANARRVRGDHSGAEEAFERARRLWEAAAPGDPGLQETARRLGLDIAPQG